MRGNLKIDAVSFCQLGDQEAFYSESTESKDQSHKWCGWFEMRIFSTWPISLHDTQGHHASELLLSQIIYKTNILAFSIVCLRVQMSWPSYSMFLPKFSRTTKTTRLSRDGVSKTLCCGHCYYYGDSLYIPREKAHQPRI